MLTGELERKASQSSDISQDAQHIQEPDGRQLTRSTDRPVDLAIGVLVNNRELRQVPSPPEIIKGAWIRGVRIFISMIAAVLFARLCGWIEIAFLIGLLGAGWLGIMAWMTVRCLLSGNLVIRALLAGGIGIPAAVMAAGYTGLSIDAQAGRDVPWHGFLKFGQTDYIVFVTGAILFAGALTLSAILQLKSRATVSELR